MIVSDRDRSHKSWRADWLERFLTLTTFILLNLLWLFGAMLIVTIPAVTAALFAGVAPWTQGRDPDKPVATFWANMGRFWRKATVLTLINLGVGLLVMLNGLILRQMDQGQLLTLVSTSVTILAAIVLLLLNVYAWPLLVTVDPPLRIWLRTAVKLALSHPLWGGAVVLIAAIPVTLGLFLPGFVRLTFVFAATALIIQWGGWRVIRRYAVEDDLLQP